ncbi:hypothetical protein [Methylobacterium sp. J-092]|uniref:hypothetical protein n=1 Tax=Methylobacterium sp. J-092 TaxID=2836667 RepID=UPI001FBB0036|nr:hypothetical protein [Methylobacterium sp. J-092]MCJ2005720.1 hypothetical protein [Methylobacterium sp. J-092]
MFREARSYREKAKLVDYAVDGVAFVRGGVVGLPARVVAGIDVGRAVRAARALREAATWLGLEHGIVPAWRLIDGYGRRLSRVPAPVVRRLVARLAQHLGRLGPERVRNHGIER